MGRGVRAVIGALVVVSLLGCTDDDGTDEAIASSTTLPEPNTLVRVGVEEWPECLNPLTCADDALREQVLQHVLPVAMEVGPDDQYRPSRLLAATPEPETIDGGVRIVYEIDPAARWADGRPITSSDFVGTWQAVVSTPGADTAGYDRIVAVDDVDPRRAVVTLDGPLVDWQELFGGARNFLLQADAFGASTDLTGQFADELPMAAGPYRLARWSPEEALLATAPPWEGAREPAVDQVQLERVELAALDDAGMYDLLLPAGGRRLADDAEPGRFERRTSPTTSILGIWLDQREPLLQPLPNRQMLDTLLDRDALAEAADASAVTPCPGWVPGIGGWCEAGTVETPAPDPGVVPFVLGATGWTRDPTGAWVRGEGERFSLLVTHDPAVTQAAAVADELASVLQGAGIEVRSADLVDSAWAATRPLAASTGVGVHALDLGFSPRVSSLYGCPQDLESSVVASCVADVVALARTLDTVGPGDAAGVVERLADRVAFEILWLPVLRMEDTSYLRPGRLVLPGERASIGGPLRDLHRFDVED